MARILFALAVFHAYGHQWPCQLVYHPCKCEGFGLSDGEGCEHFWSAIKLLIPSMHVAGVSVHYIYICEDILIIEQNGSIIGCLPSILR